MGNRQYQMEAMQRSPELFKNQSLLGDWNERRQQEMRESFQGMMGEEDLARDLAEGPQEPFIDQFKRGLDELAGGRREGLPTSKREAQMEAIQGTLGIGGAALGAADPADAALSETFRQGAENLGAGEFGQGAAEIAGGLLSGVGGGDVARVGTKGAGVFMGGLPTSTSKLLGRVNPRSAQLEAMQAVKEGTTRSSKLRKNLLDDLERGTVLGRGSPRTPGGAAGSYSPITTPGEKKLLRMDQTVESNDAIRELKDNAARYRTEGQTELAEEFEKEAAFLRKWHNRQMKALDKQQFLDPSSITIKQGTSGNMSDTAFHESMHAAQTRGTPITTPFGMTPGQARAKPEWYDSYKKMLMDSGHTPEWSDQLIEQQADLLESIARGQPGGRSVLIDTVSDAAPPQLQDLRGEQIISQEQMSRDVFEPLGLTENFNEALFRQKLNR